MLTDQQKRFIELSKEREAMKDRLKESKEEMNQLLTEIGIGSTFQDPKDNTVFDTVTMSPASGGNRVLSITSSVTGTVHNGSLASATSDFSIISQTG